MTMAAASSSSSIIPTLSSSPSTLSLLHSPSPSFVVFKAVPGASRPLLRHKKWNKHSEVVVKAETLEFSGSLFEGGIGEDDEPPSIPGWGISNIEDKEEPQCPPGLRQYETMAVLRPDLSEDERLTLVSKYEELLVAGGGMYVEVFNRGVIPLAYNIKKKNKAGETNTYMDGIYLLFTYFTKPESIAALEATMNTDDDVIRSSSFKLRKRKF
ncbi:PREDICTED: 30S ribosomal protein S6 alpha, chloroplastic-like [Ipomoea nil]|uniref:30S ribosomal protein S6 alpha, chloroplastic-like n=1 Tax=Ipomoea nil TaxID=35883 RepID=UPI000901B38A|nr:PREDICTED: 30S ribosomal protein S6 alpha, chloroplastic-like [Ipomoea nil]